MGYYVRAFCTAETVPPLMTVLSALRDEGLSLAPEDDNPADLASPSWEEAHLVYKEGNLPIPVECSRVGEDDSLGAREIREFVEELESARPSRSRKRVHAHLRATRFIICCQLLSDIDDDGYDANGRFLSYFVNTCGGLIQADGEGFYEGPNVIIPTK